MSDFIKITSASNEFLKACVKLKSSKERTEQGLFLAEGVKLCEEAIRSGFKAAALFAAEEAEQLLSGFSAEKMFLVSEHLLSKLCEANTPQGIVGVFCIKEETGVQAAPKTCIVLENSQDPGNFGTILRTAECFGVELVITVGSAPDRYSQKVLRGSMGSALRMKLMHFKENGELAKFLETHKIPLWAAVLDDHTVSLNKVDGQEIRAVAIGNEGAGLSKELRAISNKSLYIPMTGAAESLNAAVAAGIIMYKMYSN